MRNVSVLIALACAVSGCANTQSNAIRPSAVERLAPFESDRIMVRVMGSGPDVVLIPGAGSSSKAWESTAAALPHNRIHLIDIRGFAGNAPGANADGAVLVPLAEEVARYIKQQRLNRPALIGHSMGGTVAMLVGTKEPKLASKIMVVDMLPFLGAMFGSPGVTAENVKPVAQAVQQGMLAMSPEARKSQIDATINAMVRAQSLRPVALADSIDSIPRVAAQVMYDLITLDLRPDLSKLRVPLQVLYVTPSGAPVSDTQIDAWYKSSYETAPLHTLTRVPDSSHFVMWDNPAFFQSTLLAFLR